MIQFPREPGEIAADPLHFEVSLAGCSHRPEYPPENFSKKSAPPYCNSASFALNFRPFASYGSCNFLDPLRKVQSMKSIFSITILTCLSAVATYAQPNPDTLWARTHGGSGWEEANCVRQTMDGGYVVTGFTNTFGAGSYDFYLVKTNSAGDTLWTRTYGGSNADFAHSVQQTTDSGYVVVGYTQSFGAGYSDFYVVKTSSQGGVLWTRTYGGSYHDVAYSAQQTPDGGYIIAGYTASFGAGMTDLYLVKTNSQGDTLWTRTYGGSSNDYAISVLLADNGGYIVAGHTYSFGEGTPTNTNMYLLKTDALGAALWTRVWGGTGNDQAYSMDKTTDGGYFLAGHTNSFGAGGGDFYVVKTGPDSPWGLVIAISGGNVVLDWLPTGAASYNIYGATLPFVGGVLLDVTGNMAWTDGNTSGRPSPYFYYVMPVTP